MLVVVYKWTYKQLLLLLIAAEEQTDKTAAFIEVLTLNDDQLLLLHKS